MSVELNVEGMDTLENYLADLPYRKPEKEHEKMTEILDQAVEIAKTNAPVRTGRLRESIGWEQTEETGYNLYARTPYAKFQEFGTRYIEPHLFLTQAYNFILNKLDEIANHVFREAFK